MKTKIISAVVALTISTSLHAGFGDLLDGVKGAASNAVQLVSDPAGEKARKKEEARREEERQEQATSEDKLRQEEIKRLEKKKAQAEKERQEKESTTYWAEIRGGYWMCATEKDALQVVEDGHFHSLFIEGYNPRCAETKRNTFTYKEPVDHSNSRIKVVELSDRKWFVYSSAVMSNNKHPELKERQERFEHARSSLGSLEYYCNRKGAGVSEMRMKEAYDGLMHAKEYDAIIDKAGFDSGLSQITSSCKDKLKIDHKKLVGADANLQIENEKKISTTAGHVDFHNGIKLGSNLTKLSGFDWKGLSGGYTFAGIPVSEYQAIHSNNERVKKVYVYASKSDNWTVRAIKIEVDTRSEGYHFCANKGAKLAYDSYVEEYATKKKFSPNDYVKFEVTNGYDNVTVSCETLSQTTWIMDVASENEDSHYK